MSNFAPSISHTRLLMMANVAAKGKTEGKGTQEKKKRERERKIGENWKDRAKSFGAENATHTTPHLRILVPSGAARTASQTRGPRATVQVRTTVYDSNSASAILEGCCTGKTVLRRGAERWGLSPACSRAQGTSVSASFATGWDKGSRGATAGFESRERVEAQLGVGCTLLCSGIAPCAAHWSAYAGATGEQEMNTHSAHVANRLCQVAEPLLTTRTHGGTHPAAQKVSTCLEWAKELAVP